MKLISSKKLRPTLLALTCIAAISSPAYVYAADAAEEDACGEIPAGTESLRDKKQRCDKYIKAQEEEDKNNKEQQFIDFKEGNPGIGDDYKQWKTDQAEEKKIVEDQKEQYLKYKKAEQNLTEFIANHPGIDQRADAKATVERLKDKRDSDGDGRSISEVYDDYKKASDADKVVIKQRFPDIEEYANARGIVDTTNDNDYAEYVTRLGNKTTAQEQIKNFDENKYKKWKTINSRLETTHKDNEGKYTEYEEKSNELDGINKSIKEAKEVRDEIIFKTTPKDVEKNKVVDSPDEADNEQILKKEKIRIIVRGGGEVGAVTAAENINNHTVEVEEGGKINGDVFLNDNATVYNSGKILGRVGVGKESNITNKGSGALIDNGIHGAEKVTVKNEDGATIIGSIYLGDEGQIINTGGSKIEVKEGNGDITLGKNSKIVNKGRDSTITTKIISLGRNSKITNEGGAIDATTITLSEDSKITNSRGSIKGSIVVDSKGSIINRDGGSIVGDITIDNGLFDNDAKFKGNVTVGGGNTDEETGSVLNSSKEFEAEGITVKSGGSFITKRDSITKANKITVDKGGEFFNEGQITKNDQDLQVDIKGIFNIAGKDQNDKLEAKTINIERDGKLQGYGNIVLGKNGVLTIKGEIAVGSATEPGGLALDVTGGTVNLEDKSTIHLVAGNDKNLNILRFKKSKVSINEDSKVNIDIDPTTAFEGKHTIFEVIEEGELKSVKSVNGKKEEADINKNTVGKYFEFDSDKVGERGVELEDVLGADGKKKGVKVTKEIKINFKKTIGTIEGENNIAFADYVDKLNIYDNAENAYVRQKLRMLSGGKSFDGSQFNGEVYGVNSRALLSNVNSTQNIINSRIFSVSDARFDQNKATNRIVSLSNYDSDNADNGFSVWISPVLRQFTYQADKKFATNESGVSTNGLVFGIDNLHVNDGTFLGLVVGTDRSEVTMKNKSAKNTKISSSYVGLYTGISFVNAGAVISNAEVKTERDGFAAKQDAKQIHTFVEFSTLTRFSDSADAYNFYPYINLAITSINVNGVTEKATLYSKHDSYALKIDKVSDKVASGILGFRTKNNVTGMSDTKVYTDIGYKHSFSKLGDSKHSLATDNSGNRFAIRGGSEVEDMFLFGVGVYHDLNKRNKIFFEARGEFGNKARMKNSNSASIGFSSTF